MYNYIKGVITEITTSHITLETHGIGYLVKVPNPHLFNLRNEYIIYIHHHQKEDINEFYGFPTKTEKTIFEKLISVKGLGPKSAIVILKDASIEEIINAVDESNISFFSKFTGIGPKLSGQIILDLKGKINKIIEKPKDDKIDQISLALKSLGYKQNEINDVLKQLKLNEITNISETIKQALKLIKS